MSKTVRSIETENVLRAENLNLRAQVSKLTENLSQSQDLSKKLRSQIDKLLGVKNNSVRRPLSPPRPAYNFSEALQILESIIHSVPLTHMDHQSGSGNHKLKLLSLVGGVSQTLQNFILEFDSPYANSVWVSTSMKIIANKIQDVFAAAEKDVVVDPKIEDYIADVYVEAQMIKKENDELRSHIQNICLPADEDHLALHLQTEAAEVMLSMRQHITELQSEIEILRTVVKPSTTSAGIQTVNHIHFVGDNGDAPPRVDEASKVKEILKSLTGWGEPVKSEEIKSVMKKHPSDLLLSPDLSQLKYRSEAESIFAMLQQISLRYCNSPFDSEQSVQRFGCFVTELTSCLEQVCCIMESINPESKSTAFCDVPGVLRQSIQKYVDEKCRGEQQWIEMSKEISSMIHIQHRLDVNGVLVEFSRLWDKLETQKLRLQDLENMCSLKTVETVELAEKISKMTGELQNAFEKIQNLHDDLQCCQLIADHSRCAISEYLHMHDQFRTECTEEILKYKTLFAESTQYIRDVTQERDTARENILHLQAQLRENQTNNTNSHVIASLHESLRACRIEMRNLEYSNAGCQGAVTELKETLSLVEEEREHYKEQLEQLKRWREMALIDIQRLQTVPWKSNDTAERASSPTVDVVLVELMELKATHAGLYETYAANRAELKNAKELLTTLTL
eukprot:PhF_6_TR9685/c0_g1_i1/m.14903